MFRILNISTSLPTMVEIQVGSKLKTITQMKQAASTKSAPEVSFTH
jgi:hypothetical protein